MSKSKDKKGKEPKKEKTVSKEKKVPAYEQRMESVLTRDRIKR